MTARLHHFRWPFGLTFLGLAPAFAIGMRADGTIGGGPSFLLMGTALAILEVAYGFDDTIGNANKLRTMNPVAWGGRGDRNLDAPRRAHDAIAGADPAAARRAMRDHLSRSLDLVRRLDAAAPSPDDPLESP